MTDNKILNKKTNVMFQAGEKKENSRLFMIIDVTVLRAVLKTSKLDDVVL